jgi:hypothetical protein
LQLTISCYRSFLYVFLSGKNDTETYNFLDVNVQSAKTLEKHITICEKIDTFGFIRKAREDALQLTYGVHLNDGLCNQVVDFILSMAFCSFSMGFILAVAFATDLWFSFA